VAVAGSHLVQDGDAAGDELVVVHVAGHDQDSASAAAGDQSCDQVIGFGVVDLDPCDGAGVQAALDVRQEADRRGRGFVAGPDVPRCESQCAVRW